MKFRSAKIRGFKRFTNLTIQDIPRSARLIMLAGPNGCGKSSFFDALHVWHCNTLASQILWEVDYHAKVNVSKSRYWTGKDIEVDFHDALPENERMQKKMFYFRSAYRNDPEFNVQQLRRQKDLLNENRVQRMIDNDVAVGRNYQRLVSQGLQDVYETEDANTTMGEFRQKIIGEIKSSFLQIFSRHSIKQPREPARGRYIQIQ